jgi:von Willebrand factor type A domain
MDELSQVDLVFCIDLTNSMTPFLTAAQTHVVRILEGLRVTARADLRVALVGYRDHADVQDSSPTEVHPFTDDAQATRAALDSLRVGSPAGNTDAAEAVVAGLVACVQQLAWRAQSYRALVLVGDGPPHACGANAQPWPDRFPEFDPSGSSLEEIADELAHRWTLVHAMGMIPSSIMQHDAVLERSFRRLAEVTDGRWYSACDAGASMQVVEAIAAKVFSDVEIDRQVWAQLAASYAASDAQAPQGGSAQMRHAPPPAAAMSLPGAAPEAVRASMARLQKRGFVK